jgi:hypothetical protein
MLEGQGCLRGADEVPDAPTAQVAVAGPGRCGVRTRCASVQLEAPSPPTLPPTLVNSGCGGADGPRPRGGVGGMGGMAARRSRPRLADGAAQRYSQDATRRRGARLSFIHWALYPYFIRAAIELRAWARFAAARRDQGAGCAALRARLVSSFYGFCSSLHFCLFQQAACAL